MFIYSQFFVDLSFSFLRDFEVFNMFATCELISNFLTLISLDVLYEMKIFESGLIKRR